MWTTLTRYDEAERSEAEEVSKIFSTRIQHHPGLGGQLAAGLRIGKVIRLGLLLPQTSGILSRSSARPSRMFKLLVLDLIARSASWFRFASSSVRSALGPDRSSSGHHGGGSGRAGPARGFA